MKPVDTDLLPPHLVAGVQTRNRGVGSVVGYALLLVIVAFGTVSVVALGGAALTDLQASAQADQAAVAMSEFDSKVSQVALGDAGAQTVELGGDGGTVSVEEDAGNVRITRTNASGETVIADRTLGAVVYDLGETRVAYQGGGVWRTGSSGTRMISSPEYHYRGETLTFPIVRVTGDWSGSPSSALDIRSGSRTAFYPTNTRENPLEDGYIEVELTSEYHAAWAAYFRSRTDGSVTHTPATNTVTANLTVPFEVDFDYGVSATESGSNAIQSTGNAEYNGPTATGTDHPTADNRIDDRIADCESGGCDDLSAALASGPLTNGTYYADEDTTITSSSYDTSDGPVHVVVDGDLSFDGTGGPGNPDHVVSGGDQVRFYVKGDLEITGNGAVNTGDDPDNVLALVHSDAGSVTAASGTPQFTGYIYAPGTDFEINGGGACGTDNGNGNSGGNGCDGNVVGGVVVDTAEAVGSGKLQYEPPGFSFELDSGTAITYLHVTERRVAVDGGS